MNIDWYRIDNYHEFFEGVKIVHPELVESNPNIRFAIMQIEVYNKALKGFLEELDNEEPDNE